MQQLQNARESEHCAREVLEAVMAVMVSVREMAARRQRDSGGPSLIHIRAMGFLRKRPGANLSGLSDQLALTLSATSRLVDCLVHRRFVRRHVPPANRRSVNLYLTPSGNRTFEIAIRDTQRELASYLENLSPPQRRNLRASMTTLQTLFEPA
jgi:DNA-binding MarR family transcriptional regulator